MAASQHSSNTALSAANAALGLLKANKPKEALDLAEQALKNAPGHSALLQVTGLAALQLGQGEKSAEALAASLKANAAQPGMWEIYGGVLETLERYEEALNAYAQAVKLRPDTAEPYRLQGAALQMLKRFDEAIAAYEESLNRHPKQPEVWLQKGTLEFTVGQSTAAGESFAHALSLDATLAKAWRGQGALRVEQGNRDAALEDFRKAIALDPTDATSHRQLAALLWEMHHVDQAEVMFEKSLALDPDCAATLASMAAMYEQTNRLTDAAITADQALEKDNRNSLAQIVKATLARRAGADKTALEAFTHLSATVKVLGEREAVEFELARLHDKLGRTDEAFKHFTNGNQAQIESPAGQRIDHRKYIAQITREAALLETAAPVHQTRVAPTDGPADPVFLIGFPRSGTTLLDQVLNSHPDVTVMEERPPLVHVHERLTALELKSGQPFTLLDEEQRQAARRYYFDMARAFVPDLDDKLFVDKYPLSTAKIRIIKLLFPEARIIFALRHPCDVVLSCFMQRFTLNMAMTHFTSLNGAVNLYALVMGLWTKHHAMLNFKVHNIRYEDVVQDFELQIKNVLTFLDLPWDDTVLSFHQHAQRRHLRTASSSQVTQPLYTSALARWQKYASYLEPHLRTLRPFIKEFGYTTDINKGN